MIKKIKTTYFNGTFRVDINDINPKSLDKMRDLVGNESYINPHVEKNYSKRLVAQLMLNPYHAQHKDAELVLPRWFIDRVDAVEFVWGNRP